MQIDITKPKKKIRRLSTVEKYIAVGSVTLYIGVITYLSAINETTFRFLMGAMVSAIFFCNVLLEGEQLDKATCNHVWVECEVAPEPEEIKSEGTLYMKKTAVCIHCRALADEIAGVKTE